MALCRLDLVLLLFVVYETARASIHLQNPRGSGNRLDEPNRERRNRQRLFNSQANDRQGYNVGSLYYLQGSVLEVEWTNQHSCNNPNANCDIILQYMCEDTVRDGAVRPTIPDNLAKCEDNNCNTDTQFSMHEDYNYYDQCRLRERNKGLFTGDISFRRRDRAVFTRQDIRGRRYGYECPEERDYYPYWHPTPWKDIAVMTNDVSRCDYYKKNSENVKGRGYCKVSDSLIKAQGRRLIIPNNKAACDAFRFPAKDADGEKAVWTESPSHNIPAPECQQTEYTRDNHNGNGINGKTNRYNWTIPEIIHEKCILRVRYNVTSNDFDRWNTVAANNAKPGKFDEGASVPLYENLGWASRCDAHDRGYYFKTNPEVQVFDGLDVKFGLAVRTHQMGRTFEDRSFTFAVRPRPDDVPADATIYNLNVRGKRGNIVQTYPSTEYDFVPSDLKMTPDNYYHIQWTGSNTNNNGNAGNGLRGTDRSNFVLLNHQVYPEGSGYSGPGVKMGHFGVNYPMHIGNLSLPQDYKDVLTNLAFVMPGQLGGEMSELDDAGTYFDAGPLKAPAEGIYSYMCSRNNAFTNRDQKGRLIVQSNPTKRNIEPKLQDEEQEIRKLLKMLRAE